MAPRNSASCPTDPDARDRGPRHRRRRWFLPAMKRFRPMATAGAPGSVAPITSKSPADMCARYQSDGTCVPRCGSLARSGFPLAVRVPSTTQLFDPSASALVPPSSRPRTDPSPPDRARVSAADQEPLVWSPPAVASAGRFDDPPAGSGGDSGILRAASGDRMLRPASGYRGRSSAVRAGPTRAIRSSRISSYE